MRPLRVLLSIAVLSAGCRQPMRAAEFGRQLFEDPRFSGSRFNAYSCATCHSVKADGDHGRILPGYPLAEAAVRASYWGGYEPRLIDAVSFCLVSFMRGAGPLQKDDPAGRALYEYLASLSPSPSAPPLPFTVVRDIAPVPKGEAARGAEVYRAACRDCHGELHTGEGRLSPLASILPEVADDYPRTFPGVEPSQVFVEKVRHGQFFGIGGTMPLYSKEALSDADLGALLAFLGR